MATIETNPQLGEQVRADAKEFVLHSWSVQNAINPLPVAGAEGRHFWDYEGNRYLDFASQLVNVSIGHQHPKIIAAIKDWRQTSGSIPGAMDAWMLHRGLETLELRFERMCNSAEIIARRLKEQKILQLVRYPGLEDDPSHNLARMQMDRFGFLISLVLASEDQAEDFINGCALVQAATSFGSVHSSAERRTRRGDAVLAERLAHQRPDRHSRQSGSRAAGL